MGILSGITDQLFGDDGKKAVRVSREEAAQNREFINQGRSAALDALGTAYPSADAHRRAGTQAALDIYGQVVPQQFGLYSDGNLGAQQVTAAAPMQIQSALMGMPVDYSFMQPREQVADFGYLNQNLDQSIPQYAPPELSGAGEVPASAALDGLSSLSNYGPGGTGSTTARQGYADFMQKWPETQKLLLAARNRYQ